MFDLIRNYQLDIMLLLCGACGVLAILLFFTRFLSASRKKILILMELVAFFLLWFDRMAYIYSGNPTFTGFVMVRLSNFFVFFLTSAIVLGFNLYLTDWLMDEGGKERAPFLLRIVQFMSITGLFLAVISAFTGLYYYFDNNNVYHRGDGFLIAYVIPVVGPVLQFIEIHKNKKLFSRLIYTSLVLYIFVPIACGILQIFTYGISIVNMAMTLVSIFLYFYTYLDINDKAEHAHRLEMEGLQEQQESMHRLFDQTAMAFVKAVEKKDEFSEGHSAKVAYYARRLAREAGKNDEECEKVYYAALLHDVGQIGIPDEVINSEEELTEEELAIVRQQPEIARDILSNITEYPYLGIGAYASRECYDGSGYPEGLSGEEIPELGRIIAVADAYVSMTSKQRFRDARPDFLVREAFVKGAGEQFDPLYANLMVKILDQDSGEEMKKDAAKVEEEFTSEAYRDFVSNGIPLTGQYRAVSFDCEKTSEGYFAPSLILYDAFDGRVHRDSKTIAEYGYQEYAELWFDGKNVLTAGRNIEVSEVSEAEVAKVPTKAAYSVYAGKYEDHLQLFLSSPEGCYKVIVALLGSSNGAYVSLTGEHCRIRNIKVTETETKIKEGDIKRIADWISYTDRLEADLKNLQIESPRSDATEGIPVTDGLKLRFHTMTFPTADLVWHCPYLLLFSSDNGRVDGENYKEYAFLKLNGEDNGSNENAKNVFRMHRDDRFPGWEGWKEAGHKGMECEISFARKKNRIVIKTENLGICIENETEILNGNENVYAALTGDQCALTDIRVMEG